jgi:hypothetical protein
MIRKNIRELVYSRMKKLEAFYKPQTVKDGRIPPDICTLGELQDYLNLIPDGAIEHAIQDEMDAAADEARNDARCMGHHI